MRVYPAIDLLGGRCVRLLRGAYDQVTTFAADPVTVALGFRDAGATWLHIVDLDGARLGHPVHLPNVAAIAQATGLPVRLGGGLRTADDLAAALDAGATRVTVGTAALDGERLAALVARFGDRLEVALDRRGDRVAIAGWQATSEIDAAAAARLAVAAGARLFLVTDISRDGTLTGANTDLIHETRRAVAPTTIEVTIAGGVTTLDDVRALARAGADGAVIGRALYVERGRLDLAAAIAAAQP